MFKTVNLNGAIIKGNTLSDSDGVYYVSNLSTIKNAKWALLYTRDKLTWHIIRLI